MNTTLRSPPPGASASGLYECLRALAEEARSIGLHESARTIMLAADLVALEADENGILDPEPARRQRGAAAG